MGCTWPPAPGASPIASANPVATGHGGPAASLYVKEHLHINILESSVFDEDPFKAVGAWREGRAACWGRSTGGWFLRAGVWTHFLEQGRERGRGSRSGRGVLVTVERGG